MDEHESGLVPLTELGARVYNPATGRFLQTDPIEGGTLNDYVYVTDPINQFDLTGQFGFGDLVPEVVKHAVKKVAGKILRRVAKMKVAKGVMKATTKVVAKVMSLATPTSPGWDCGHGATCHDNVWFKGSDEATTIGTDIFCGSRCDRVDGNGKESLLAHEQVHVAQFQNDPTFMGKYLFEAVVSGNGFSCGNKYEDPAYVQNNPCDTR